MTVVFIGCDRGKHSASSLEGIDATVVLTHARCTPFWYLLHEPEANMESFAGHIGATLVLTPFWYLLHES